MVQSLNEFEWLTDPIELGEYATDVYHRRHRKYLEGSILPLALAKLSLADLKKEPITATFNNITRQAAHEIEQPRLVLLQQTRTASTTGNSRPSLGWHIDRSLRLPPIYSFRFILAATSDPELTTRFAGHGSRIVPGNMKLFPAQPEPETVVQAEVNTIYFMPVQQTVHASPGKSSGDDAVFLSRFAHFAFV